MYCAERALIESRGERFCSLDANLHFKNIDGRYGHMSLFDLGHGELYVIDKRDAERCDFADVEALLAAGWAID